MTAIILIMAGITLGMVLLSLGLMVSGWLVAIFATVLGVSLVAAIFVFWIFMLISAIRNKGLSDGEKIGWVLAIVFFHVIGSLLYLLIAYRKRNRPPVAYATV